jgi:SAM-dependent methyltransferase
MLNSYKIFKMNDHLPTCQVCSQTGQADSPKIAIDRATDYITDQSFQVLQCPKCKLAWTSPCPSDLNPFYPGTYRRYTAPIIAILKTLYRKRVQRWSRHFTQPGSALEIGCGDGFMLDALRSLGWSVTGTERTDQMSRFAREHFGITVYSEDSSGLPKDDRYDMIILFQVLEHLANPVQEINRYRQLLKPGGRIVIGVPNFTSWQSRYAGPNWFHLDVPRHLFHHSPESMQALAKAAGLAIQNISFYSPEHDPYGWIQSILNKHFANANRLTKILMRMTPVQTQDIVPLLLIAPLSVIAIALSLISWGLRQGAVMEIVLREDGQSYHQ